jgi:hypothetical protein
LGDPEAFVFSYCKEFAFGGRLLKEPIGRTGLPVVAFGKDRRAGK